MPKTEQRKLRPGRRIADRRLIDRGVLAVVCLFVYLAITGNQDTVQKVQQDQRSIQIQRQVGVRTSCEILSAVSSGGEEVIVGSAEAADTPFTHALEKLGFPPRAVRLAQARALAAAYAQHISAAVIRAVGKKRARGVIRSDGTINCTLYVEAVTRPIAKRIAVRRRR